MESEGSRDRRRARMRALFERLRATRRFAARLTTVRRRRVVTYDEVPLILRQAILSAEDNRFFSHSGVDYRALPRVVQKTAVRSVSGWWKGGHGFRLLLPQGGSTLTQQLVRGYFLQTLTSRTERDAIFHTGLAPPRVLSVVLGASATNKLLRKMEEVRLTLWLEQEMRRRYGSPEQAKREIFARYASFIYLGNGRYGYAAASEYYFGKSLASYTAGDAGNAALLAAISTAPRDYAPVPGNPRPLSRRNQILALMARNGYIPESLATRCQGEPVRVAAPSPAKTDSPAAIEHVLSELARLGGTRFGVEDLFQGRILVSSTVDARVQVIVNEALEHGLAQYEKRHPKEQGLVQGSVVVLGNADAAKIGIPAAGGAIIGGIIGGKKGAAIGATIGGGGGTAVVLTSRGPQIRLDRGAALSLPLEEDAEIRVPIKKT